MKRGTSFSLVLLLVLMAANTPVNAQFFNRVFVHVFNININGLSSTTDLVLHNPGVDPTVGEFNCFNQDGQSVGIAGVVPVPPGETITRGVPEGFVGTCVVSGGVISTAIWEIQVANNSVLGGSGVSTSRVGQHSYDRFEDSMDWALAVGEIPGGTVSAGSSAPGSNVGVAIHNTGSAGTIGSTGSGPGPASCLVDALEAGGATTATIAQAQLAIPTFGQIATFPFDSQDLAGKTISLRISCDRLVFAIAVIQDAANGFPTPSFGFPLP